MFDVRPATLEDIAPAVAALGDAFVQDPLMLYFFGEDPKGVRASTMEFFSILLAARIALNMPAYVLVEGEQIVGAAMGYDTSRPVWPPAIAERWRLFEASTPAFPERLAAYEAICTVHEPEEGHYYLGVIGVQPSSQGRGGGNALLEPFCARSRADPKSRGVFLETASPSSLEFYYNNGFELLGKGTLDAAHLWCVYMRT